MTESIKLSASIDDYTYDEATQKLFIKGAAIRTGVWHGVNSQPLFFPAPVLIESASKFNHVPIACEHNNDLIIGEIVQTQATESGFDVVDAYVTSPSAIQAILSGSKLGFSIEAEIIVDPITSVVQRIVNAINISLVKNPACRICGITDAHIVKNGGVNITEEQVIEEQVDASVPESAEKVESVDVSMSEPEETKSILDEIKSLVSKFESFVTKFDGMTRMSEPAVQAVEMSAPSPVAGDTPVELELSGAEIESLETYVEEKSVPSEQPAQPVEDIDLKFKETLHAIHDKQEVKFVELETSLAAATDLLKQYGDQIIALSSKVQELEVQKVELASHNADECAKLIEQIKEIDSETDDTLVATMSVTQLSAYKAKVESLSKPKIGGTKASVPRNGTVVTPTPANTKTDLADRIAVYLKTLEH